jgi:predicted TIM-barrel fold metal-dependent hydrolase
MIIDVNASLGPYPFRRLRHNTVETALASMGRNGIDRAVVSSLPAVFYRDAHRGNEELWTGIGDHARRLIPVAAVNPKYVGWERDLAEATEVWGTKAVALWPGHHGYALGDEHGRAALAAIARRGVPVVLTQRLEDRRQRHHWDQAEDLTVVDLLKAARSHPQLRFLLVNWAGLDGTRLVAAGLKGRCLIDFARLQVVFRKEVPRLIETLGVESIAFGSHLPFDYVGSALVKLANLEKLPATDFEKIAWRNAAQFLGLQPVH